PLVGFGDVGDECGQVVGGGIGIREAGRRYQKGQAQNGWHDGPHQPRGRPRRRPPACASHSTQVSYGSTRRVAPATDSPKGAKDNTSIICTVRHTGRRANAPPKSHSLRAFNVTER